jgi:hypothetical protein
MASLDSVQQLAAAGASVTTMAGNDCFSVVDCGSGITGSGRSPAFGAQARAIPM